MQELLSEMSHPNWDRLSFDARYEMFDILLEKEKEQIMNAVGLKKSTKKDIFGNNRIITLTPEEYYNQKYNQNK